MSDDPTRAADQMPVERPLYPADRTFVIEIQRDAAITAGLCLGRVEHINSGQVVRFADVATLLRFLAEAIGEESGLHAVPGAEHQQPGARERPGPR